MQHRYGRHGPHAWKRLQEWKYVRRRPVLPVPVVPTTMMVRIVVPPTTERIIVILMHENPLRNEDQQPTSQELQLTAQQTGLQPTIVDIAPARQATRERSEEENPLVNSAQLRALFDAKAVKRLTGNGQLVRINRPKLEERIDQLVDRYFENIIASGGPTPGMRAYQAQANQYKEAYLTRFNEGISDEMGKITLLNSAVEARLREIALLDRQTFPSSWPRPMYQRDLAVMRVLIELDISLNHAREEFNSTLETIHKYADIYEKYFAGSREEVTWPNQDPF